MDIAKTSGIAALLVALAVPPAATLAQTSVTGPARSPDAQLSTSPRQGLSDLALKLTDAQKARIERIVQSYAAEERALVQRYPAQGLQSAEALTARKQARARLTTALDQVLNEAQRKILKATEVARISGSGPIAQPPVR